MKKSIFTSAKLLLLSAFFSTMSYSVSAQEIAFAFDKTLAPSGALDGMARTQMLIRNLIKADVPQAMFLIHTDDIRRRNEARLMMYDDAGQLIVNAGNNTNFYKIPNVYNFEADILLADTTLESYLNYHQHIYFPYLYEGGDSVILQKLYEFLDSYGFQKTYVSYKASDDYLDSLYQIRAANNKPVDIDKLSKAYVNMIVDDVSRYDTQARLMLGFSPRQVVLLHETDLTAYFIIDLVDALTAKGFKIVSPEKIFSDPVVNPFFVEGYSAVGYMEYIMGMTEARRSDTFILNAAGKEKIHGYLREQGLNALIP